MVYTVVQVSSKELEQWPKIIEAASKTPLGIFALMLLLIAVLALAFFRKANAKYRMAVFLIMFLSLVLYGYTITRATSADYRVRVIVVGQDGSPVDNAHVWSSFGGEPMKIEGGWMFVIPAGSFAANQDLTVFAEVKEAFAKGNQRLKLGEERNPTVTVQIARARTAKLRGSIEADDQAAIPDARVSVIGYEEEGVISGPRGGFELLAHAAEDEQVEVHVEKNGYRATNMWCPAGDSPCVIILSRVGNAARSR